MDNMEQDATNCTHRRQVLLASTEWVCEDCVAVMDAADPDMVVAA